MKVHSIVYIDATMFHQQNKTQNHFRSTNGTGYILFGRCNGTLNIEIVEFIIENKSKP